MTDSRCGRGLPGRALLPFLAASVLTSAASLAASIAFHREVVNLEDFQGRLGSTMPANVTKGPGFQGDLWYGAIPRQLPGDKLAAREHDVPFVVVFQGASVVRARADANLNGDLSDDSDAKVSLYPSETPGRSFLVDLRPAVSRPDADVRVGRLVRVVVAAAVAEVRERTYLTQEVYGMLGTLELDGVSMLALLYDANHDGCYTKGSGDGMFVDLDGDRHFPIDVMAPEFGPFASAFAIGRRTFTVDTIDLMGTLLGLKDAGPAIESPELAIGRLVPDIPYIGTDGRLMVLGAQRGKPIVVYFWASWCGSCRDQAAGLRALYDRYGPDRLEILSVSYDSDKNQMERFRRDHGQTWPTSFSGGAPSEDPVGRSFRERGTGVFYVIDADGRLAGKTLDVGELNEQLTRLRRSAP